MKERVAEVCAHYLGDPIKAEGTRLIHPCPCCGSPTFAVNLVARKAGCWTGRCAPGRYVDSLDLISYFEGIKDFEKILERGYRILGLPEPGREPASPPSENPGGRVESGFAEPSAARRASEERGRLVADDALRHAVYGRILEFCPLNDRDMTFWLGRGADEATVREGRFGSLTTPRARKLVGILADEFGNEALLGVPGFRQRPSDGLAFTLTGDYALIPYHNAEGLITTLEGRHTGEPRPRQPKYVSLYGSGSHLYVHPRFSSSDIQAVCEGPIGAIVAARYGVPVGAIQGFRRYRNLPELAGVDFRGRRVPYIPDVDDPPKEEVISEAPKAAAALVEARGGVAALVTLPSGKDLDEWILHHEPGDRGPELRRLLGRSYQIHALPPAADPPQQAGGRPPDDEGDGGTSQRREADEPSRGGRLARVRHQHEQDERPRPPLGGWHAALEDPESVGPKPEVYRPAGGLRTLPSAAVTPTEVAVALFAFAVAVACIRILVGYAPAYPTPTVVQETLAVFSQHGRASELTAGAVAAFLVVCATSGRRHSNRRHLGETGKG